MDIQLDELLNKIKTDGIKTGEDEALKIVTRAKKEAAEIEKKAREDGEKIKLEARDYARKLEDDAVESIKIQGRDLLLKLRNRIRDLFNEVVFAETGKTLSEDILKEIIVDLFKSWNSREIPDLNLFLSPDRFNKLEQYFKDKLSSYIKQGLKIQPDPDIDTGFKISVKDGSLYYDFSISGIGKILAQGLNPKLAEILNKSIEEN